MARPRWSPSATAHSGRSDLLAAALDPVELVGVEALDVDGEGPAHLVEQHRQTCPRTSGGARAQRGEAVSHSASSPAAPSRPR